MPPRRTFRLAFADVADGAVEQYRSIVLTTGNKSEMAGDTRRSTATWRRLRGAERHRQDAGVPARTSSQHAWASDPGALITRPPPPSSERTRPIDSLPPYDVLDAILEAYVEQHSSPAEIVARGMPPLTWLSRAPDQINEYKRRQRPWGSGSRREALARIGAIRSPRRGRSGSI